MREIIGPYRVSGDKSMEGGTFVREIWGLKRLGEKPETIDLQPLMRPGPQLHG